MTEERGVKPTSLSIPPDFYCCIEFAMLWGFPLCLAGTCALYKRSRELFAMFEGTSLSLSLVASSPFCFARDAEKSSTGLPVSFEAVSGLYLLCLSCISLSALLDLI